MKFEEEVKNKVEKLLWQLLDSCESLAPPDPETFRLVSRRLTRMSIRGTTPPACNPRCRTQNQPSDRNLTSQDTAAKTESVGLGVDDFSSKKESFIAP